jgi:hypothetical protein
MSIVIRGLPIGESYLTKKTLKEADKILKLANEITAIIKKYQGTVEWEFSYLNRSPDEQHTYAWFTRGNSIEGLSGPSSVLIISIYIVRFEYAAKVTKEILMLCSDHSSLPDETTTCNLGTGWQDLRQVPVEE